MRKGVSAVEFSLVMTALLVVLLGVMDWSWYMYHWLSVTAAAGRGVRLAAGVSLDHSPTTIAQNEVERWLDRYDLHATPTITASIQTRSYAKVLYLQVSVPFEPLIGLVPTPAFLRGSAEVLWYGDVETP